MGVIVKYGILLGVLVVAWMFVMGFTGWYKDPMLLNLFWVVILLEAWVLLKALGETARLGAGYAAQVGTGFAIASVAGIIIFGGSLLFTTIAFPNYFAELRAVQAQMMRDAGMSDDKIAAALQGTERTYAPVANAIQGFIGTVVTGIIMSAIAAIWVRHKPESPPVS